ncbi:MAG: glycoside hydrolase domain-containing protein [Planctomycetota bacterium]
MKSEWNCIIAACCLVALLTSPAVAELVLHYDFSERDGDVLHDSSGHALDARIHGAQWISSDRGAALDFDGVNDFVECGNPPELRISGALTLAVWVRTSPQPKNRYVLSKYGWSIYIDPDGRPHLETRNAEDNRWVDLAATQPIRAGEWNLIVAVHDPSVRRTRIYVNGEPAGEMTRDDDSIGGVRTASFCLAKFAMWSPELNGLIGGVMVFNESLSADRIAQLYRQRPDDTLVITPCRFRAKPRYYYRQMKLGADLQLMPRSPLPSQPLIAGVRLLDADGKTLAETETPLRADHRACVEFGMPAQPGDYTLCAVVRVDGQELARTSAPVDVKPFQPPPWIGSQAGVSRDVPPPWTPLQTHELPGSVVVEPSGRSYEFKPDSLVSAINVGEHNLLAAPVRLIARTSAGEMPLAQPSLSIVEASRDRVHLSSSSAGEHPVQVIVTIDYDGMIVFDWRIINPPNPLASLTLEIPLAEKYARLFWHNRYPERPWAEQKPGLLPEDGFAGPFLPALWLGDENLGLQWFAESDAGWRLAKPDRAVEIVRAAGRVTLRVHVIDAPTGVGKSISGSFGLQATPVKPWGKTIWDYRFRVMTNFAEALPWYESEFDKCVKEQGVRTLVFFEAWTDAEGYVRTSPEKAQKLREMVKTAHARGIRVLLYFGRWISSLAPEADTLWDECVREPAGGWLDYNYPPQPRQKVFSVCYNSIWQDLLADGIAAAMDDYDLDGVYLDGTGDVLGCTNTHHGCGYVAPDGSVRPTYQILPTRTMLERIYRIVKSRKPDGLVKLHQSGQMIAPIMGFATSYWDGEQFTDYQDKFLLDFLPLDAFRTEFMGRQWGVPAEMLQYRLPGTEQQKKALFLLHDVNDEADYATNKKLFQVFDDFGRADATWLPYWSNGRLVTLAPKEAKASLYLHPENGVLVLLVNTGKDPADLSVQLNLNVLGNVEHASAVDAMSGEAFPLDRGCFSLKLDSLDWRLIWVKP